MHSYAVIAGLVASANAYAYGYPAQNETSSAPVYGASSSAEGYPASSAPAYPASSAPAEYTTSVVTGLTTVCPEPTTLSVGSKTYTITTSTTLVDNDCEYTTSYAVAPTPAPVHSTPAGYPVKPSVVVPPVVPYPSANGTAPAAPPAGTAAPSGTATKPSPSQFTGAAAQTGAAMLAIVGAMAAFAL